MCAHWARGWVQSEGAAGGPVTGEKKGRLEVGRACLKGPGHGTDGGVRTPLAETPVGGAWVEEFSASPDTDRKSSLPQTSRREPRLG